MSFPESTLNQASINQKSPDEIKLNPLWEYSNFSKISTGSSFLYYTSKVPKKHTIAINAGHGTKNGSSVKTLCHPDSSPKTTGGSTKKGEIYAIAVGFGTVFVDGISEAERNLKVAKITKELLLNHGYDVLMIRNDDDVQLDNIARTVIANQNAEVHISIHFDAGTKDKGAFYLSVPDGIKQMMPVKNHWEKHNKLGMCLIEGLREVGIKIFGKGNLDIDLTQTSYSTIPSVDIELGDQASDVSDEKLKIMGEGLMKGIDKFFKECK